MKRRTRSRPKTFKTEEAANKYAENRGLKDYKLVDLCSKEKKHKFKIVS